MVAATGSGTKATGLQNGTGAAGGAPATGNTSKGGESASSGSKAGGGKMGANSSQSGGVKSSAGPSQAGTSTGSTSKGGYSGPKGTPSGGLNSAAKSAAAAAGTKNSGYSGPKGTPSGGLNSGARDAAAKAQAANNRTANTLAAARATSNTTAPRGPAASLAAAGRGNYLSGQDPASLAARARAVSRGPGVLAGTRPGSTAQAQLRTATSLGLAMADRYGLNPNRTVATMQQIARTIAGETSGLPADQQAAAARALTNRMDAASLLGLDNGVYSTDPAKLMNQFDANGITSRVKGPNAAFNRAVPGTNDFAAGLDAVANAMSPYGNLMNAPAGVQNATHYNNPTTSDPSWGRTGTTPFGPHTFSNPDISGATVANARNQVLGSPGGFGTLSPATPANTSMPALASGASELDSKLAALQAKQPQIGASNIPTPREQLNGYLGGMASLTPARPTMPSGGFPAAPAPNMNMAGYQSPMVGLTGMPQAPSNMNMAGYQSPMAGVGNVPNGFPSPALGLGQGITPDAARQFSEFGASRPQPGPQTASNNPIGGMSFTPGLPSPMDNGFVSQIAAREGPYAGPPAGMPAAPYSGAAMAQYGLSPQQRGMTTAPTTVAGMPSIPAPTGFPAAAAPGYQNPGRSFAGIPSSGFPQNGIATAEPEDDPMDPIASYDPLDSITAPKAPTTVAQQPPSGGLWGGLTSLVPSVPSIPGVTAPMDPETKKMIGLGLRWAPFITTTPGVAAARQRHQMNRNAPIEYAAAFGAGGKKRKPEQTAPMGLAPPPPEDEDLPVWLRAWS